MSEIIQVWRVSNSGRKSVESHLARIDDEAPYTGPRRSYPDPADFHDAARGFGLVVRPPPLKADIPKRCLPLGRLCSIFENDNRFHLD